MKIPTFVILMLGLAAISGCGNTRTLIGAWSDGGSSSPEANVIGSSPPDASVPPITQGDQPFTIPAALKGVWQGYFEGFALRSGSDVITLTLSTGSDGVDRIDLVLGVAPPPSPPTDPTAVWPPGAPTAWDTTQTPVFYVEGFSYPAHEVVWQGARLTFKVDPYEAWDPWCKEQTSYSIDDPAGLPPYNCVPGWGGAIGGDGCVTEDDNGAKQTLVSCGQYLLCDGSYCACDVSGCSAAPFHNFAYDITFEANLASGVGSPPFAPGDTPLKLLPPGM